jgi:hypothetical protein
MAPTFGLKCFQHGTAIGPRLIPSSTFAHGVLANESSSKCSGTVGDNDRVMALTPRLESFQHEASQITSTSALINGDFGNRDLVDGSINNGVLASACRFKYAALVDRHDIRLLRLSEEENSYPLQGSIRGRLRHISLEECARDNPETSYLAISYCWGDPVPADRIWLSETEHLPIAASASYILRRLTRKQDIWIDSICIDQSNDDEKSQQVFMMWGIYKFAERVIAWLGGPEEDSELAMSLLFDFANSKVTKEFTGRDPVQLPTIRSLDGLPGFSFKFDQPSWTALSKLLERPWFRRVWVIQEMVAAKGVTLVCGREKLGLGGFVDWKDLVKFVLHLKRWGNLNLLEIKDPTRPWEHPILPRGIESIQRIETLKGARDGNRRTMQQNLVLTACAEATDPRDKVFAIGSFSYGTFVEPLVPHYHLTVQEVYINATRYILINDQSLLVLHMAGIGWERNLPELPSWVPDYSRTRRDKSSKLNDLILGNLDHALYSTASTYLADTEAFIFHRSWQPKFIHVGGIVIDDIQTVCEGLPSGRSIWSSITSGTYQDRMEIVSWLNKIRNDIHPGHSSTRPYISGKPRNPIHLPLSEFDALWRTLIVGTFYDNTHIGLFPAQEGFPPYHETFNAHEGFNDFQALLLHSIASFGDDPRMQEFNPTAFKHAEAYIRALDRVSNWTVFRTVKGYIGRGPPFLKPGDQVCAFMGGRTPFVIRKVFFGPLLGFGLFPDHELVGECYVEGLMRKEVTHSSPWRWRPITLV